MFIVAPDYSVFYWDIRAEFLTCTRAEDVLGEACYDMVLGERENGEPYCS